MIPGGQTRPRCRPAPLPTPPALARAIRWGLLIAVFLWAAGLLVTSLLYRLL